MRLAGARSETKRFSELLISYNTAYYSASDSDIPRVFRMTKSFFGFGLAPTDRPQMEKPPVIQLQTRIWFSSRYRPRSSVRSVKTHFNLLLQRTICVKCNQEYMTSKGKPTWTEFPFTYRLLILICTRKDEVLTSSLSIRIILDSFFCAQLSTRILCLPSLLLSLRSRYLFTLRWKVAQTYLKCDDLLSRSGWQRLAPSGVDIAPKSPSSCVNRSPILSRMVFVSEEVYRTVWTYATCTSPTTHLICPAKFCISIVFNFPWDGCKTQEKWKTKFMQFFFGGGGGRGGGAKKVHYRRCASDV